jgi:leucyl-tRNA synthetase
VAGARKFINRIWNFFTEAANITDTDDGKLTKVYHQTVKKVTADFEVLGFNTAIAQMMVFVNEVYKAGTCPRAFAEGFIKMISCITPHVGEEIWLLMGHDNTIAYESWPTYDEAKCKDTEINIAVQVNGKMRGTVLMEADLDNDTVVQNVLANEKIAAFLAKQGGSIVKTIVVKNKLVNLIVK